MTRGSLKKRCIALALAGGIIHPEAGLIVVFGVSISAPAIFGGVGHYPSILRHLSLRRSYYLAAT